MVLSLGVLTPRSNAEAVLALPTPARSPSSVSERPASLRAFFSRAGKPTYSG